MKKQIYTISIYTENNLGLLNRISSIFLKRHINIESLTASSSEIENVTRLIIVAHLTEEKVKKVIGQIEKQIEVIKAYYHTNEESIYIQSALFKIKSDLLFNERQIQNIIKNNIMTGGIGFGCMARYIRWIKILCPIGKRYGIFIAEYSV